MESSVVARGMGQPGLVSEPQDWRGPAELGGYQDTPQSSVYCAFMPFPSTPFPWEVDIAPSYILRRSSINELALISLLSISSGCSRANSVARSGSSPTLNTVENTRALREVGSLYTAYRNEPPDSVDYLLRTARDKSQDGSGLYGLPMASVSRSVLSLGTTA